MEIYWKKLMYELRNKEVLVVGLGARGRAACRLLHESGARVLAVDTANNEELRNEAGKLRPLGIEVELGVKQFPPLLKRHFNLAVVSPAVRGGSQVLQAIADQAVPVIGEFELGFQQARCLNIAVAGTNGKGTTSELIAQVLAHNGRKAELCGHGARPICSAIADTKDLDFLILQVNAFQLERTQFFRPAVAVLLNLTPDHLDRFGTTANYITATARLFQNQQPFDWAIIQSEALAELRALGLPVPAKVITFSANNRRADIFLDRGMIISRLPDWSWPLLDLSQCQLRGPHNAENFMAALAVGHVLRLPLEAMVEPLKAQSPAPHCLEFAGEINGVQFINDSKATNVDALNKALLSMPVGAHDQPNVWLIAGGKDKGLEYHALGPLLSQRVKGSFLIGEAREKIRAAWGLFTPCTLAASLLEAFEMAVASATPGDIILLSPACSSFDQFENYQQRGELFCAAVQKLSAKSAAPLSGGTEKNLTIAPGFLEEKPRGEQPNPHTTSIKERTLNRANH